MSFKQVDLEDGWANLKVFICKLIARVDAGETPYSSDEFTTHWMIISSLCNQKLPHKNVEILYDRYKDTLSDYLEEKVLPHLIDKRDQYLLKELTEWWPKYLSIVEHISYVFAYLNLAITETTLLPNLKDAALTCFYSLVYKEINPGVKDALLAMLEKDRKGEKIERALVDRSIKFCGELKCMGVNNYSQDFGTSLVKQRQEYHSRIVSGHIFTIEFPEYMKMAEQYLNEEDAWASEYLDVSNHSSLMETLQAVWWFKHGDELLQKSGFTSLLQDERKEDLQRIFNTYRPCSAVLDKMTLLFKQSIDESLALHKVDNSRSEQDSEELTAKRKMYSNLIEICFDNHPDFFKVLYEAFAFRRQSSAESSMAPVLAHQPGKEPVSWSYVLIRRKRI
ncbi:Cullin N-terminal protein [Dioscorea alata]|uniref:Cullin N-terminal protein n=1 Tax=Dioscorea alata TaxID=55571 RepID=A0ACB7UD28_DIOAL|nr:Cullin N-terminal protein [Dioscorea alata]